MRRYSAILLAFWLCAGCASSPGNGPGAVAAAYAAAGRYDEAAREIEVAVRAHPRDVALRQQAALIQAEAGQLDHAVGHLEAAIELEPSDSASWVELGEIEKRRQNVADAYVAYRRAAELSPDDIRAVSGLALTADHLGFDDEARGAYARWAELERELEAQGTSQARPRHP